MDGEGQEVVEIKGKDVKKKEVEEEDETKRVTGEAKMKVGRIC